jgi:hypothetical protein
MIISNSSCLIILEIEAKKYPSHIGPAKGGYWEVVERR